MHATRFAINNPKGAEALAAELRVDQYRNAHKRLDQSLRRWPAVAIPPSGPPRTPFQRSKNAAR